MIDLTMFPKFGTNIYRLFLANRKEATKVADELDTVFEVTEIRYLVAGNDANIYFNCPEDKFKVLERIGKLKLDL